MKKEFQEDPPTATIVETKTKHDVVEKTSILVVANNGTKVLNIFTFISNSVWIINYGVTYQ
jgi:hypothetical protein